MKILFLNSNIPNYVTDGLFHGLHATPDITVVDVPRMDYMYVDASREDLEKTGSKGNTLYGLLKENKETLGKRTYWQADIEQYDYVIFSDIFQQCDLFHFIYKSTSPSRRSTLCIVDGNDVATLFPYFNFCLNLRVRPWTFLYRTQGAQYFKREFNNTGELYGLPRDRFYVLNTVLSVFLPRPKNNFYPITMSIPEERIEYVPIRSKAKDFIEYNIDAALSSLFPDRSIAELGKWQPAFQNQEDYYDEIRRSRFGITAKRAGWDCLRHYEYAAKGAILCFKDLKNKSELCAPLGLDDTNCISYTDKDNLVAKIKSKSDSELESIQEAQYRWVENFTTIKVASGFLNKLNGSSG